MEDDSTVAKPRFRLLYIEDNPANLRLMQQIFRLKSDFELVHASTAEMGLELVSEQYMDAVLLDINLPGMDGYVALEQLCAKSKNPHSPVIAVTANAMDSDIVKGQQAGFYDYLAKPIDIKTLLKTVDTALHRDQQVTEDQA